jgi:formate/nitrite transporter
VLNGASLFTSNIAYMTTAFIERRASALSVLGIWALSWVTNFCGALLLGQLMLWGEVFHDREGFTIELALKKTHYPFGATLVKGILCNWLVCIAVWQANASQDIASKVLAIWLPISAFVAMGFEHCVANMFALPLAIRLGAPLTISHMFTANIIPATLGNIIGGAFFVATAYGLSYGAWEVAVVGWGSKAKAWALRKVRRPAPSTSSSDASLGLTSSSQPNGRGQLANMV